MYSQMEQSWIWVTVVFLGDKYIPGAMVVAKSLQDQKSQYPAWCMVTPDVTSDGVAMLEQVFDKVITIPLIEHKCVPMKSAKQNAIYSPWIHASFTKCNILNPEYFPPGAKLIFIDADMMFLQPCDDLFDVPAPAQTFSSPWAFPHACKNKSYRGGSKGVFNPYFDNKRGRDPMHKQEISHKSIQDGLQRGIVGLGCMIVVEPSANLFDTAMANLDRNLAYGNANCISGWDEQLFAETWIKTNTRVYNIHQKYTYYVGKDDWIGHVQPMVYQWYNGKPWFDISSPEDVAAAEYDDVRHWWKTAGLILCEHPGAEKWFYGCKK